MLYPLTNRLRLRVGSKPNTVVLLKRLLLFPRNRFSRRKLNCFVYFRRCRESKAVPERFLPIVPKRTYGYGTVRRNNCAKKRQTITDNCDISVCSLCVPITRNICLFVWFAVKPNKVLRISSYNDFEYERNFKITNSNVHDFVYFNGYFSSKFLLLFFSVYFPLCGGDAGGIHWRKLRISSLFFIIFFFIIILFLRYDWKLKQFAFVFYYLLVEIIDSYLLTICCVNRL